MLHRHHRNKELGWIEVICGSMFSGKTEELLRRVRRAQIAKQEIQLFKPSLDNRYSATHVQSHDSNRLPSQIVDHAKDILDYIKEGTRVVGIDEAQFFDHSIIHVAQALAQKGIQVIIAGLDMDSQGIPFGPMPNLLAIAEEITKLSAVCVICGNPAYRTQLISKALNTQDKSSRILVGAKDLYEARCRACHEP